MDVVAIRTTPSWKLWLFGGFIGLIWFGPLVRVKAQEKPQIIPELLPPPPVPKRLMSFPSQESVQTKEEKKENGSNPNKGEPIGPPKNGTTENGSKNGTTENGSKNGTNGSALPNQRKLTVDECVATALQRSPLIKAVEASLQSAETGQRGLEKTSRIIHSLLAPDLEYRKEQAAKGIQAATAELEQTRHDVKYSVVRTYYSAVFAKEQLRLVDEQVIQLEEYLKFAKTALEEGLKDASQNNVDTLEAYLRIAKSKKAEATNGYRRALAAVRHEMNVSSEEEFDVAEEQIPNATYEVDRNAVIQLALQRRGEIMLAEVGVDVSRLEVNAQGAVRFRLRLPTAASGADFHAKSVPQGSRDGEYRPDAIGLDYPPSIVGDRKLRVEKAINIQARSEAVLEVTRNLVKLEAENGYFRWKEATEKLIELRKARDSAKTLLDRTRKDAEGKFLSEKQITPERLWVDVNVELKEARYAQILALAALERITAGGVHVAYPSPAPVPNK